jgi:hypothetical protein
MSWAEFIVRIWCKWYIYWRTPYLELIFDSIPCFGEGGGCCWEVHEFVTSLEGSTLLSLYLQNNYLSNFRDLGTTTIPPTVVVCVQYNCELPPPQSICPESQGFVAWPLTECIKAAATHLQILFLFQPMFWMFNGFLSSVAQSFSLNQANPKKSFLGCWGGLLSLCL